MDSRAMRENDDPSLSVILEGAHRAQLGDPLFVALLQESKYYRVMNRQSYIYILFNKKYGTLYVGVTSDLQKRIYEHKAKAVEGFTKKYDVDKLGYYEVFDDITEAIKREKKLKKYYRRQKIALIEKMNPNWQDLYNSLF